MSALPALCHDIQRSVVCRCTFYIRSLSLSLLSLLKGTLDYSISRFNHKTSLLFITKFHPSCWHPIPHVLRFVSRSVKNRLYTNSKEGFVNSYFKYPPPLVCITLILSAQFSIASKNNRSWKGKEISSPILPKFSHLALSSFHQSHITPQRIHKSVRQILAPNLEKLSRVKLSKKNFSIFHKIKTIDCKRKKKQTNFSHIIATLSRFRLWFDERSLSPVLQLS